MNFLAMGGNNAAGAPYGHQNGATMSQYIESGFAKISPCGCSAQAVHSKTRDANDAPVWACRNCGRHSPRIERVSKQRRERDARLAAMFGGS